jgi:hypothetical protein
VLLPLGCQFVNNAFRIMAKISILFDEEHVPDSVFEGMDFGGDDVDTHLIEEIDDIGKQPALVFAS